MDRNGLKNDDRDYGRSHQKHLKEAKYRHYDDDGLEDDQDPDYRHSKTERRKESPSDVRRRRERSGSRERDRRNSVERERSEKNRDKDRNQRSFRDSSRHESSRSYGRDKKDPVESGNVSGDESTERQSSRKRKEYEVGNDDALKKRSKNLDSSKDERKEVKRERRRFGDRANDDSGNPNGNHDGRKIDGLEKKNEHKFKDRLKEEDYSLAADGREEFREKGLVNEEKIGIEEHADERSFPKTMLIEKQLMAPGDVSISSHQEPLKVSTISTTNEKDGVNIARSDEVPGNFSADKSAVSVAGKSGSLSLDALAKAKKALQMQRELSEKLKKIPLLNKIPTPSSKTDKVEVLSPPASSRVSASKPDLPGPNIEAVKRAQELAARMGFHHDPQFAPLINMFPGAISDTSVPQKPSKAPVLRLDALGREIDEHGNVINLPKPTNLSTLKVNINKQKKEAFQILKPELDVDSESHPHFDERMGINKTKLLRPKKMSFQFVEEGRWSRQAEIIRFKSQFGEAQAKELKMKQTQLEKAKSEPDINPNLIEVSERVIKHKPKDPIPEIEWWDRVILLKGTYNDDINMDKITIYVEHPLPIEPMAEPPPPPPQPLKLTKKEQKKLRTQRRLAKERDRQEMIRQGLIDPPKPKVKMSNLMKVLGSEATQDPTKLEMEIRSAAAERERAHVDRNIARKLTPAEKREKKERKLFEDPFTVETVVSVYRVNFLIHPKARFQVDVNAQENRLTGCAVISDDVCVIVVEGGKKSNKRYKNLMLKRIDWELAGCEEDDGGSDRVDRPVNKCLLAWEGSVVRPSFNRFLVHQCRTEAAARKVFADAGVEHYWDLAVNYSEEGV